MADASKRLTPLHTALLEAQMKQIVEGKIKLVVDEEGRYIAKRGRAMGRGRSPRQAVEALPS